jgi:hypothetical protein
MRWILAFLTSRDHVWVELTLRRCQTVFPDIFDSGVALFVLTCGFFYVRQPANNIVSSSCVLEAASFWPAGGEADLPKSLADMSQFLQDRHALWILWQILRCCCTFASRTNCLNTDFRRLNGMFYRRWYTLLRAGKIRIFSLVNSHWDGESGEKSKFNSFHLCWHCHFLK